MDDVIAIGDGRSEPEHGSAVHGLGWAPRPPAAILRRSPLEQARLRQLQRLGETRPRWHARVVAAQRASRRFWDAVLPRERVLSVTVVVVALTVFDGLATVALVGAGVATEANPLLAGLIERVGLVPAMGVRVVVGTALALVLAWLATWRREVRPVLALVVVVLTVVAGLHALGIVGRLV